MDMTLAALLTEAQHSFRDPRGGVRRVMALNLPLSARWLALGVMVIFGAILTHLSLQMIPPDEREMFPGMMQRPIPMALLQGAALVTTVYLIYWVGRARGGVGSFADTIVMMAWLQFLMLCLQIAQLLILVLLPPLAGVANLAGFGIFLWLLTSFVAELHGFRSLPTVLGGLILGLFCFVLAVALVVMVVTGGTPA